MDSEIGCVCFALFLWDHPTWSTLWQSKMVMENPQFLELIDDFHGIVHQNRHFVRRFPSLPRLITPEGNAGAAPFQAEWLHVGRHLRGNLGNHGGWTGIYSTLLWDSLPGVTNIRDDGIIHLFSKWLKGTQNNSTMLYFKETAHPSSINWFRHCDFSIYVHVRNLNYYSVNQFWGSDCWIQVLAISPDSCVPFSE